MTAVVVSYLGRRAQPSLDNHRRYARRYGYRHEVVDVSDTHEDIQLRTLYKYEVLLHTLRRISQGQIVLLLTENAAIIDAVPLEKLVDGRDWMLVRTWSHPLPQTDVQIWRRTDETLGRIFQMVKRCRLGGDVPAAEGALFDGADSLHFSDVIDGIHPVMQCGYTVNPVWASEPTFAISIDSAPDHPERRGISGRFRDVLVNHLNERKAAALPLFTFPGYDDVGPEERSVYQPGSRIAVATLYTPDVASFGRIAERNMRRYCERHGYTLYVHRNIPPEVGLRASGNWFKPWLLQGYLKNHEWVVWLDADILIADQNRPLEPELEGRDWLLAHDVGQWPLNAGVIGLRRTHVNDVMLSAWMTAIVGLSDRSTVYSSNGDQFYLIQTMTDAGRLHEEQISDFINFNTPWMFRRRGSFIVHYFGMWEQMRALMMSHDEGLTD